jgi:hypothetical protein
MSMPAPEGHCWLCHRYGKLSKEHIPPESAFNDCPLLLLKIAERCNKTGVLEWTPQGPQKGLYYRSLCEECNNKCGRLYAPPYVDLVRRVAERIGDVQDFHRISLFGIKRPLAILKQIVFQFVTANGEFFVQANEWVGPFVRARTNGEIPRNVCIYVFASNTPGSRKSGVSSHLALTTGRSHVVSEFSFWPLGTVISFDGELPDNRLTPIHHWVEFPFDYKKTVDLHLSVNPTSSAYPVDFRTESEIANADNDVVSTKRPSYDGMREMIIGAQRFSGEKDSWVFSGHPETVKNLSEMKVKE